MGDWFNMKPFNQLWEGTWRVTCTRWSSEERQCRIARNSQEFWQIWMGILKSFNHRISNGHTPGCEIMMMTYTESKYRTKFVFSLTYKTLSYLGEDHIITTEISNDTKSWFFPHQTSSTIWGLHGCTHTASPQESNKHCVRTAMTSSSTVYCPSPVIEPCVWLGDHK